MSFVNLDFLNKNMYRKYPFRASSDHIFTDGRILPQSLIVAAQITTVYGSHNVYISKIYAKNDFLSIVLQESDNDTILGHFSGKITKTNQTLTLIPKINNIFGSLTIGDPAAIKLIDGVGFLDVDNGKLEDSTIFCFEPPEVTAFLHNNEKISGFTSFLGKNVAVSLGNVEISLGVPDKSRILSKNDKSGVLNNCGTPLIRKINSVSPDVSGNIDVYGVDPISLGVITGKITVSTPDMTLNDVCPERNKLTPPVLDTTDVYYTDILTATEPEWKTWPQFSL